MDVLYDNTTIDTINQSSDEMCFRAAATVVTVSSPRSSSHNNGDKGSQLLQAAEALAWLDTA